MECVKFFESLGDNCEFGFVQRALGFEESSLFRWALILNYDDLINLLENNFEDFYKFENLIPIHKDMLVDAHVNIQFHTNLLSFWEPECAKWIFQGTREAQLNIYKFEFQKIEYLLRKFKMGIASREKIYVIKKNSGICEEKLILLLKMLRRYGKARVLYVKSVKDLDKSVGHVELVQSNIYCAYIDKFADYEKANEISLDVWQAILEQTYNLASKT